MPSHEHNGLGRIGLVTLAVAVWAAAMWFAWLGWDHTYYEVDGVPQGPYRPWQVVGCGATVALGAVAGYLLTRRIAAIVLMPLAATIGFAIPWALDAAASDNTGLWVLGLGLLVVFGGLGLLVLVGLTALVRRPRKAPTPASAGTSRSGGR